MYHKKFIPQSEEFTDIKILLIVAVPPSPLRPRQLPCLPTPRPGSARGYQPKWEQSANAIRWAKKER
jgi:hypothetical protein